MILRSACEKAGRRRDDALERLDDDAGEVAPCARAPAPTTASASLNGAMIMSSRTLFGMPAESGTGSGKLPERFGARLISE